MAEQPPQASTYRSQPHPAVTVAVIAGGSVCWIGALAIYVGGDPWTVMAVVVLLLGLVVLPLAVIAAAR